MWNPISAIMGSPKAAAKLLDAGIRSIDALVFTKEEKAEKQNELWQTYIKWMDSTKGQDIARRTLALLVGMPWTVCVMTVLGLILMDSGEKQAQVLTLLDDVNNPFMLVMVFYFAPHMIASVGKAIVKVKNGK